MTVSVGAAVGEAVEGCAHQVGSVPGARLSRHIGDQTTEASTLSFLGAVAWRRADALTALGIVHEQRGEPERAVEYLQQALTLCRQFGYRAGEADALNALGDVLGTRGALREGPVEQTHASSATVELVHGDRWVAAHQGIWARRAAAGDPDRARQHWEQALAIYADLGLPESQAVRAKLLKLRRTTSAPDD